MKRIISAVMSAVISLGVFSAVPVVLAENNTVNADLGGLYNSDYFVSIGDKLSRNDTCPQNMYNGEKLTADKKVELTGEYASYEFLIDGGMRYKEDDVCAVKDDTLLIPLCESSIKYLGVLINGVDAGGEITYRLNYKNESTVQKATVYPMTENGGYAYSMGMAAVKGGSAMLPRLVEGTKEVYLNLLEIVPDKINAINSIEFEKADFDYHVIALTQVLYNEEDLKGESERIIEEYLPLYQDKTIIDINDEDIEYIEMLMSALETVQNSEYEKIKNLRDGYLLYKQQTEVKKKIDSILEEHSYPDKSVSDLEDNDLVIIDELAGYYDEAELIDTEKLNELLKYFGIEEDISIDIKNREIILKLKSDYMLYKEQAELEKKINELFGECGLWTSEDLSDSNITTLDTLISYYKKADEIGLSYNKADREKITKLRDSYVNYKTSENDVHFDLSKHYNRSMTAEIGEELPENWGFSDSSGSSVGIPSSAYSASHKNGITTVTGHVNYPGDGNNRHSPNLEHSGAGNNISFELCQKCGANDKNAVVLANGEKLVLKGNGRTSKALDLLVVTARGNQVFSVDINFTDGTSYKQERVCVAWSGYYASSSFSARKLENKNGTAAEYAESNYILARAYSIPIEKGKIIDNVIITNLSNTEIPFLAVTEEVISNSEYREVLKTAYDAVSSDGSVSAISKFYGYYSEAEKRGLDVSDIVSYDEVQEIQKKVLTAEGNFYRKDKDTVNAKIVFSQPVTEEALKKNMTVTKNGEEINDYKLDFDGLSAMVEISETAEGNNEYNLNISADLPLRDYPSYKIVKEYNFDYTSLPYIEMSLTGSMVTVKNNTETSCNIITALTEREADNSVIYTNFEKKEELEALAEVSYDVRLCGKDNVITECFVWDWSMKPVTALTDIQVCKEETVNGADYMYPQIDFGTNSVRIAGFTPSKEKDKIITAELFGKDGKSIVKRIIKTNNDGYFSLETILNETVLPQSTWITIKLGGDDFDEAVSLENVYFSTQTERTNVISSMINAQSANDVYGILSANLNTLAIDAQLSGSVDLKNASEVIFANKSKLDKNNVPKSRDNIRRYIVISAFNQKKENVISSDGYFLFEELMNYKAIDSDGVTLYKLFKNNINEQGRKATINALCGKNYGTYEAFMTDVRKCIALNALIYPSSGGTGYVTDVLTKKNADAVDISISKYLNMTDKSGINKKISESNITSLADVVKIINDYKVPESSSGGTGGGNGSKNVTLNVSRELNSEDIKNTPDQTEIFTDIDKNNWAYEYVRYLYDKGIISGKGNGKFEPQGYITRAELVKIICGAKGINAENTELPFADTDKDKWYYGYICAAYSNGIISGISESEFAPESYITRQDLCTVLYRLLNAEPVGTADFTDYGSISDYAKEAVNCFAERNIINGFEDNSFRPFDYCTRAQCAKIIYTYIQQ